jgi:glycosyltransferase involved in cell wall biosynthesis
MSFFSVCIPAYNREKTIFNTLESLSNQQFRDFEVKIVDCGSTDRTRVEINRFLDSKIFAENPFDYEYICKDYSPKTIEDWNEPVKLAKGKYIAMLEGDDQFLPNHLLIAYNYLITHCNVGIYATGSNNGSLLKKGYFSAKQYFLYIYSLKYVPPPSQAIFVREYNMPFYYNEKDFLYAPEIELYLQIVKYGFSAFHDNKNTVYRYPSSNKLHDEWKYYHDHFYILKKYKNPVGLKKICAYFSAEVRIMSACIAVYAVSKSEAFKKEVIQNVGYFSVVIFLFMRIIYRGLKTIFHERQNI